MLRWIKHCHAEPVEAQAPLSDAYIRPSFDKLTMTEFDKLTMTEFDKLKMTELDGAKLIRDAGP